MTSKEQEDHKGLRNMSTSSDEVAEYYDEWAEDYDQTLAQWRYEAPEQAAGRLRSMVDTGSAVLDAGCGTGLSGKALREAGFATIDGIDVSQRSLDVAAKRGVYRNLQQVDMQKLPLPCEDDTYGGLVCVGVLTYLPDSSDTLKEFSRIVHSGGAMVLTQRTDILQERNFAEVLEELEIQGLITEVSISEPGAYLPDNEEFGNEVMVHYITCRVV